MINKTKLTYISLFSGAGVGCFAFKKNGFECILTNEIDQKRVNIQKFNKKCKYETGYISGNIESEQTKKRILEELRMWKEKERLDTADVLIATPPCQGMSLINHNKKSSDLNRNSLIVESIHLVLEIKPKIFIFENVSTFLKTACVDKDGEFVSISTAIDKNLAKNYEISKSVVNLKFYGSNSSRTRTIVIGVRKDLSDDINPIDLFPNFTNPRLLGEVISSFKNLSEMGEISNDNFYHAYRSFDKKMLPWIVNLKEGSSAFDNLESVNKPHKIVDNKIIVNKNKNSDKYKRQSLSNVGACVHTRNDQLASQNTIHPKDNRVFSISELMALMSIPKDFKWLEFDLEKLNSFNYEQKLDLYRKNELTIRKAIGESVPTEVFNRIAIKIKAKLGKRILSTSEIKEEVKINNLYSIDNLKNYIKLNKKLISVNSLIKIIEISNPNREENSGYFTDNVLTKELLRLLPDFDKDNIKVLEPAVGLGALIKVVNEKYKQKNKVIIDCIDKDKRNIEMLKFVFDNLIELNSNVKLNYIVSDYFDFKPKDKYDLVISNPPFTKSSLSKIRNLYHFEDYESTNFSSYFLQKSIKESTNLIYILPKSFLIRDEFRSTRNIIAKHNLNHIVDFGEKGFKDVLIETICISVNLEKKPTKTLVISLNKGYEIKQLQTYIVDDLPYWVIYRNNFFDDFCKKLVLDVFTVTRDRQITKKIISDRKEDSIRLLKASNLMDDGNIVLNNNLFVDKDKAKSLSVGKYIDSDTVYLTPNMTYKTRLARKITNTITDGSLAILTPKLNLKISDFLFYSSEKYREFFSIALNYQTRTINIDKDTVYFLGVRKNEIVR